MRLWGIFQGIQLCSRQIMSCATVPPQITLLHNSQLIRLTGRSLELRAYDKCSSMLTLLYTLPLRLSENISL